jgi:hypothetical protein
LAACRNSAEHLRAGKGDASGGLWGIFRGEPKTSSDYDAAAVRHEDALIKWKRLARKEFRLRNAVSTSKAMDRFTELALKRFPNKEEWSCVFSANGDSVVITAKPEQMGKWEEFIREFDATKTSKRSPRCRGKRTWFEAVRASAL